MNSDQSKLNPFAPPFYPSRFDHQQHHATITSKNKIRGVYFPVSTGPRNRVPPRRKPSEKAPVTVSNDGARRLLKKPREVLKLDPTDNSTSVMIRNIPNNYSYRLNAGYAFVNFTTSEAAWKFHLCVTGKSWPLFESKKIAEVVRARIQGKRALIKNFEEMRLCSPSKEYLPVWFDPPRDGSMSCSTTKGMHTIGGVRTK
ncbi:RNA recognition motif 2, Nucleotide-binding alpha-beta plait domain protein [Artemisia annua]|uniref:RNA recognition motif 2, Nucleotide-binding alpha-beta plait domain protein n=1 Tax=Artemisia annua TaxID=35608 RepID=A0A2U1QJF2_ARTAN|nr:RNA recognition motif 2, Nucleotide-binding alpha-beta plait domain protein [Artemisia annua]